MLVTVNKVKRMALHGSHASQITSSKTLVTQTLFCVSNEILRSWSHASWVTTH